MAMSAGILLPNSFDVAVADTIIAATMEDFAWSKRPVVIFAASDQDPRAHQQRGIFAVDGHAIIDRDMVVITVWPDRIDGPVSAMTADDMRRRYGVVEGGFQVLLIGKDTGVKRRAETVLQAEDIFGQIDSMPMRRREMLDGS